MSGNTEQYYRNRKTVTGIDSVDVSNLEKFVSVKKVGGVDIAITDKAKKYNKGGLGWSHVRFADPTFSSYTITTVPSNEYTFEIPATLKRIKNLYCMPIMSASSTSACSNPFQYFNIQLGDTGLPRLLRDHMTVINTAFENNSESFTYNAGEKGYTSALASDALTTTSESRLIDLSPMLYENMFTSGNPTKVYIKYAFDTIANSVTASTSVTVSGIYFVFTEWLETDAEFKLFQAQFATKVRVLPYLYPFRIDIGSITSSTSATTTQTIAQLSGRVPALFVGLYDSGATINQNSHIYSQCSTVGFLDVNDQNLVFNWDIKEAEACVFAQKHGLSNALYVNKTHVIPFIFCKDIYSTIFDTAHITSGGMTLKLSQERIRILPASTATGTYSCIVFGWYYGYITLSPDGRLVGTCAIVDA